MLSNELQKRKYKVQVLDNVHLAQVYYQRLYWGSMGTSKLHEKMVRVYNKMLSIVWK